MTCPDVPLAFADAILLGCETMIEQLGVEFDNLQRLIDTARAEGRTPPFTENSEVVVDMKRQLDDMKKKLYGLKAARQSFEP